MDLSKLKTRNFSFWVLHISGWLAYAVAGVIYSYKGKWTEFPRLLLFFVPYLVAILTCVPLRLFFKKIRFHEWPLTYSVLMGIAASFVAANLWLGTDMLISLFIHQPPYIRTPAAFKQIYLTYIIRRGIPLLGWTFLYLGIKIQREWKLQEQRARKADSLAQNGQLQMLRYQLNPHFLFNAMNSIRALIDEDETKAREMITELSEFLRYSLDSKDYSNVPLKHEIEAIQHYFAIQKKRYEDKLEIIYDIDPQAGEFPVLSFLIHPLVENAVKYGMQTSPMPLTILVRAKIRDGTLVIEICNTGKWIEPALPEEQTYGGTGTGLENVRRRLENAFPNRHALEAVEKEGHVHVILEIRRSPRDGT
jgi:two-component system LytT family sensor kinase